MRLGDSGQEFYSRTLPVRTNVQSGAGTQNQQKPGTIYNWMMQLYLQVKASRT